MDKYANEAVPFRNDGNRLYLSEQQIAEAPWLKELITQYRHCFTQDPARAVWWYYPNGKPN